QQCPVSPPSALWMESVFGRPGQTAKQQIATETFLILAPCLASFPLFQVCQRLILAQSHAVFHIPLRLVAGYRAATAVDCESPPAGQHSGRDCQTSFCPSTTFLFRRARSAIPECARSCSTDQPSGSDSGTAPGAAPPSR